MLIKWFDFVKRVAIFGLLPIRKEFLFVKI